MHTPIRQGLLDGNELVFLIRVIHVVQHATPLHVRVIHVLRVDIIRLDFFLIVFLPFQFILIFELQPLAEAPEVSKENWL